MSDSKEHGFQLFDLASDSVQWSRSQSSIRTSSGEKLPPSVSPLSPEGGPYRLESKYDCVAFVVHCAKHDQVAVAKRPDAKTVWLPFTPLPANKTRKEGAMAGSLIVLSGGNKEQFLALKKHPPYSEFTCMHMLRLQLPQTLRFVTRLVYYVKLDPSKNSHFKCCTNTKRIEWMAMAAVARNEVKHAWGPELAEFCRLATKPIEQSIKEYTLDKALTFVPREPPRNLEEATLRSINITEKDVERLYLDYLDHTFPSSYLSPDSFKHYLTKYGFETNDARLDRLFRSFNQRNSGSLSFHEFLIGLALLEPYSQHGDLRTKFIFTYYDTDSDGFLSKDELQQMVNDMFPTASKEEISKKLSLALHDIGSKQVNGKEVVCLDDFRVAVGAHKFRGTSSLCRSSKVIFQQISSSIAERTAFLGTKSSLGAIVYDRKYEGTCKSCTKKKYRLASHKVQLAANGTVAEAHRIDEEQDKSHSNTELKRSLECVFKHSHVANVVLNKVRSFNRNKGTNVNPNGLMANKPDEMCALVEDLCQTAASIVKHETKCRKVPAPCYIIGDIHGNLEDLLSLEKAIWPRIPCVGANYLFLGDYVDRGRWSLECALYLIAFKCLCPSNVTLLRGNHEVRELQVHYTYKTECLQKYGRTFGPRIWEATNALFDLLPVAAVVDRAIFCAHGGIPKSDSLVENINKLPLELKDPQHQSPVAWQILWSDPCHMNQFNDLADVAANTEEDIDGGFINNQKRGTAYLFNDIAAHNFLSANQLSYIVRAHEVPQQGFDFHFGNKCATIFSCSHYCGNNNLCGVLLVDPPTIRVIRLDTFNNAPATD